MTKARIDRFMEKVSPEPNTGCWLWLGSTSDDGYAEFGIAASRKTKAHRYIYKQTKGPIPEGLELDHLCRVRCCVNPLHLEAVTKSINQKRGLNASAEYIQFRIEARRKKAAARTHCCHGHELNAENTYMRGHSKACRACMADACKRARTKQELEERDGR